MINIDYHSLSFNDQRKIDKKAYSKYYNSFSDLGEDFDGFFFIYDGGSIEPLTFNSWYGTELHKKFAEIEINIVLRKQKLKKIEKAS